MSVMQLGDYYDAAASLQEQRQVLEPKDTGHYLVGYLHNFALVTPAMEYTPRDGGAWVFPFLARWWPEPGAPAIPQAEITRYEMGRLNRVMKIVLETAYRRGEIEQLTRKRGRELTALLRSSGLGYLT